MARLARLGLRDDEIDSLAADLNRVLDYVGKLDELDTDAVEPTAQVVAANTTMRDDEVLSGDDPDSAVANAPNRNETFFVVPRIIE